uniref:Peptidase_M41 domain-containing protein n=1 Tax=Heterorhabditis bacteriophora TaxID=37862 RepID=A0A1I7WCB2_HETBA
MDQLRIDTYGGETAGSGYNWVTEFTDEGMNLDAIRQVMVTAQETGIAMIRSCIKITQEELLRTRQDEQMLTEFIAESYEEEFNVV